MKKLLELEGIITVLNTPFTKANEVDILSLEKNVEYAINSGVVGVLVPAMASEVLKLTLEERELIVGTVIKKVAGRIKVIGGASAENEKLRLEIAKKLINLGCDGILCSIPYENEKEYTNQVKRLDELKPKFLMLQDWDFGGYGIPVKVIKKLFETIESFRSFKIEVVPAGKKYTEVLRATNGELHVSGGWAVSQFIEGLDRGIHAFMPTGMHEIYVTIFKLYKAKKKKEAQRLFYDILPILAFSNQHLDISIHYFKNLLYQMNIYDTPNVRNPICNFDEFNQKTCKELIDLTKKIIEDVNNKKYSNQSSTESF